MTICPHCHRETGPLPAATIRFSDLTLRTDTKELTVGGRTVVLPNRPAAMLATLMQAEGRVCSLNHIMDGMDSWSREPDVVRVYKRQIKLVLEELGSSTRIACIRSHGYRLVPRETPDHPFAFPLRRQAHRTETGAAIHG